MAHPSDSRSEPILLASDAAFSEPCFPWVLSLSLFLSVTIWVTSLGSVCEAAIFTEPLFYPNVLGVTKWYLRFRPHTPMPQGRIGQVVNFSSTFTHQDYQGIQLDPLVLPPTTTLIPAIGGMVTNTTGQTIPNLTVS